MSLKLFTVITSIIIGIFGYGCYLVFFEIPEVPNIPLDQWWGPNDISKDVDKSIKPFKITFEPEMVQDLNLRLESTRLLKGPLEGIGFQYGFNTDYLKTVIEFWKKEYRFESQEKYLNSYPHFKTKIQGLDIHYVHVKPKSTKNLNIYPLLLLHGWPGTFVEFYKSIPLLTTPKKNRNFVFELIIPSLPGYGFSQATNKTGLGTPQIAVIMKNLMNRLGFKKYIVQGGDWGSLITSYMTVLFPDDIFGYHTNMPTATTNLGIVKLILGSFAPSFLMNEDYQSKVYPLSNTFSKLLEESGYMHLQATKPDTIGVALDNSPVGLAAYILEKFSSWTDMNWKELSDGGLTKKFSLTELLDNVMIYWVTNSITTSMRLYAENFSKNPISSTLDNIPIVVPTAITRCANELIYMPTFQIEERFKKVFQINDYSNCGHFFAFEEPELFANDLWDAVPKFENHYKNILKS